MPLGFLVDPGGSFFGTVTRRLGGCARMATARKPFIRIETSLLREPWKRDEKTTLVMLACFLGDRWARDRLTADQASRATLTPSQLHSITGRAQLVHSRRALRALGVHVTLAIRERNEFTEIHWPKFPITQELESRGREFPTRRKPESAPAQSPAQSQAIKSVAEPEPEPTSGAPAPAPATKQLALVESPDAELQPPLPCAPERLLNVLAKRPGSLEDKRAWLYDTLPLIVCEVVALGLETQQQRNAKLVSFVIRWWNQECRRPGGGKPAVESFDERAQRQRDEWLRDLTKEASA